MAYAVAKELGLRPLDVLSDWTCEELLVAYGVYANQNQANYYDMLTKKERRLKKMTSLDRWAIPFLRPEQVKELASKQKEEETKLEDMEAIAQAIFG